MRLRGGKITITELESIYGLDILFPNHFRIKKLRSFIQNERLWSALQKHLEAILRDYGHLLILFSINTHQFFITLDEDNFLVWFLNMYRVPDNNLYSFLEMDWWKTLKLEEMRKWPRFISDDDFHLYNMMGDYARK
jgi:hypothetical protein